MGNKTMKQETRKRTMQFIKIVTVLVLFTFMTAFVTAVPFVFSGFAQGDCYANAYVNITIYNESYMNNPAYIINSTLIIAGADGSYGGSLTTVQNTNFDINISATNPNCSTTASGSVGVYSINSGPLFPVSVEENVTIIVPFYNTAPGNDTKQGNNNTQYSWTDSGYTTVVNYTLEVDNNPGFGSLEFTTNVDNTTFMYQLQAGEELPNGLYYWRVHAVNSTADIIDTTDVFEYTITAGAPVINNPNPANGTWFGSSPQTASIDTDLNANCRWADTPGVNFNTKTAFDTTGGTTHQVSLPLAAENQNDFYFQCNNSMTGVLSNDYLYSMNLDTTPPTPGTVVIEGGATHSTDTIIDFTWSGFDGNGSDITTYYYNFTDNGGTTDGDADPSSPGQLTGASQGGTTVYVWAEDDVGNIGNAASDSITVDSLPPNYQSWTQTDLTKYSTGNFYVTVTITDTSNLNGDPSVRYRIGSDNWTSWEDMDYINGGGGIWNYDYTIPEQASPNTWFERNGENLSYQVSVRDQHGFWNNVTRREYINEESTAPVFDPIADQVVDEDETLTLNLTGSDVDYNVLTYTCNISGATIMQLTDFISQLSWTPTNDDVGSDTYQCNVTDGTFTVSQTFTITVTNVNDAPILQAIGDLYAQEYEFFNYTLNASDPDGDLVIYSSNSTIFSVNGITGKFAFTPFASQRGTYDINFSVSDAKGGVDYEVITFTVGYCGDGTCEDNFESCSTCEVDCGICGEEEKQHIIVGPRNCLDELMTVRAVTLVPRATCEEEGLIVDGMEVCGNESNTNLEVLLQITGNAWEEAAELVTDDDGYASFTPSEAGEYKVMFSNDDATYTLFEVKQCLGGEEEPAIATTPPPARPSGPTSPPTVEEPVAVEEPTSRWSFFSFLLYFFVIPLLLITLIVSSLGFAYRWEKSKQKETGFVRQMSKWYEEWDALRKKVKV
ncbi:hypothetical protein GF367_03330, partial [Candidatus Woesearchaeota archaeon]|nr:hypothetical protein [Candidatus Woesearchaeota archaeon]